MSCQVPKDVKAPRGRLQKALCAVSDPHRERESAKALHTLNAASLTIKYSSLDILLYMWKETDL